MQRRKAPLRQPLLDMGFVSSDDDDDADVVTDDAAATTTATAAAVHHQTQQQQLQRPAEQVPLSPELIEIDAEAALREENEQDARQLAAATIQMRDMSEDIHSLLETQGEVSLWLPCAPLLRACVPACVGARAGMCILHDVDLVVCNAHACALKALNAADEAMEDAVDDTKEAVKELTKARKHQKKAMWIVKALPPGLAGAGGAWVAWRGARGVRSYLLIVNDDNDRESLIGYTHTTAGYVAVGVDDKWDPTDTNKKLQLTHTGRRFENELDTW